MPGKNQDFVKSVMHLVRVILYCHAYVCMYLWYVVKSRSDCIFLEKFDFFNKVFYSNLGAIYLWE